MIEAVYRVTPFCCKTGTLMSEPEHARDVVTPYTRFFLGKIPKTIQTSPPTPKTDQGEIPGHNRFHDMIPTGAPQATVDRAKPPMVRRRPQQAPMSRQDFVQPPTPHLAVRINPHELIACLYEVDLPKTARRLFCLLFELGLETVRERGLPTRPDVAVFHVPLELLAAHLEVDRVTIWRNLKPLTEAGILAHRDHFATLRNRTAVSGKIWAVSLSPARVLAGKAAPVRVTKDDLAYRWRDLDADARRGRTAYSATRTEAQQAADKARREARTAQHAEQAARAETRAQDRAAARKAGQSPLQGRAAATVHAAQTRAQKATLAPAERAMQQSLGPLKTVGKEELKSWALSSFKKTLDVTLTVAKDLDRVQDVIHTLPVLTCKSRRGRSDAVEGVARKLAAAFEDSQNLRFWTWLIWQMLRAYDQGQDWSSDIKLILLRVYLDTQHDQSINKRFVRHPGAVVVNELRNCGLLEALSRTEPTRVGVKPKRAAA